MNRYLESSWFRNALLLLALAAGGLMTLVVPSYQEMAAIHVQPARPSSATGAGGNTSRHITAVDVGQRQFDFLRCIT